MTGSEPVALGATIRELREATGMTRSDLARAALVSPSHLRNVENGHRAPGPAALQAIDAALSAGGRLAALTAIEGDDMRRRSILAGLGAAATSPAAIGEAIRESLMASIAPAPADDWHATADRYGYTYMTDPAEQVRDRLAGDLIRLRAQLDGGPLHAVAARLAMVYGMVTATTGDTAAAIGWYRTGRALADASGDTWAREWTYGRSALTRGYEGADPAAVVATADTALALSDRPSLGRLEAATARAQALALAGDQGAALESLDCAYRLFERLPAAPDTSLYGMPEWRMHLSASLVHSRLGLVAEADRARDQAAAMIPPTMTRFRVYLGLHEAILDRDPDHATTVVDGLDPGQRWVSFGLLAKEAAPC